MAGDECAKDAVQAKQTGPEGGAYCGFEDLVVSVVGGMKRGDVVIRNLVRMFSYFSDIRSERSGKFSTAGYCLPDNR